ncbi:MAG: hypothetical protein WCH32_07420 [Pseudomonadota bacterium]
MSAIVALVTDALRHKLAHHGVSSLTPVEWHLLHVSQFLDAIGSDRLQRLLSDTPIAELNALADGLDAIRAPEASAAIRAAIGGVGAANRPGEAAGRQAAIAAASGQLEVAVCSNRAQLEQRLLDYAFLQPELMTDPSV